MKFTTWIDYPSMSIAIQEKDGTYRCVKYVNKTIVRNATKLCDNLIVLEIFLKGLPNPPLDEINSLIKSMKKELKTES
jgi:hypothetical protein